MYYAQLDENNICTGISELSGAVPEYNYSVNLNYNPITKETTQFDVFVSRMIEIPVFSENFIGLKYENQKWAVA